MVLGTLSAGPVFAHAADAGARPLAWSWDPWTLVPQCVAVAWYAVGLWRLAQERSPRAIEWDRVAAFVGGIAVLFLALQSPIDTVSDELFSVHMVQHMLLMLAAPPLLVWSDPALMFLRAFPRAPRKAIGRIWAGFGLNRGFGLLMHPIAVWAAFCGGFVFWHAPGPYLWGLRNDALHVVEHLTFFLTSLAFWSIVIPAHGRRRLGYGATLLFVLTAAVLSDLPGALMIFAPRPLYPVHADGVAAWGLTLMEDQQLAGLIMWIPGGLAYLLAAGWLFIAWMRDAELRALGAARRAVVTATMLILACVVLAGCNEQNGRPIPNFDGNAKRGNALIQKYGCGGCHSIPRVANANGNVGPPLIHIGTRTYIAGVLHNSPENMANWVRNPQRFVPGNAMPDMNISQQDSRDITAFLYSLR